MEEGKEKKKEANWREKLQIKREKDNLGRVKPDPTKREKERNLLRTATRYKHQ